MLYLFSPTSVLAGIVMTGYLGGAVATHWIVRPTLLPALLYGIATVVSPFFIMQPSLDIGIACSRTPPRLKSLATNTVFESACVSAHSV